MSLLSSPGKRCNLFRTTVLGAERDLLSSQRQMQPLQPCITYLDMHKPLTVKMQTSLRVSVKYLSSICRVGISKRHRASKWWVITIVKVGVCTHFWYRSQIAVSQEHWNGRWNLKSIVVLLSSWTRSLWALSYPWGCLWTRSLRSIVLSQLFVQIPVPVSRSLLFQLPKYWV